MGQPQSPSALPPFPTPPPKDRETAGAAQKRKLPTARELISHYESQGMDAQEASLKVIDDLQNALFRVVTSGRGRKDKFMAETSRKLDTANTRLAILEMKVDSKPGYGETFAIGVASGAALKGIGSVLPNIVGAVGQIWDAVKSTTKSS
ncbi:uncharacterized protein LOC131158027 [Malania oleifera]|uniref:uncharacterized protein LOC131158027 n=1 Tax=Malania oleifera TaxID=397392 RepID=UPI0025AE910F|nr:uncharacterized protein LOC131158027 [Malania oleifera]